MSRSAFRRIGPAILADTARVTGDVKLGHDASVWFGAAIRGDVAAITIGDGSNVQDNATVHCDSGRPNHIGADVIIGHNAVVHGESVGDGSLIGIQATVLGRTRIGKGCLIAAGAVVPPWMKVPDGMVVMGVPGRVVREVNDQEREYLAWLPAHYRQLAAKYADTPDAPDVRPYSG
ncbi:MAG: gamma carbonic anhydrase family protein [Planctomycetota bacterium]